MFAANAQAFIRSNGLLNTSIRLHVHKRIRSFSSGSSGKETTIHVVGGEEYDDIKQFRLVKLPTVTSPDPITIASLCVKRNIIFGTRQHMPVQLPNGEEKGFVKVCLPLLRRGLEEAGVEGDQPQGLAALNGLSKYCHRALLDPTISSAMEELKSDDSDDGKITLEAVQAVATQVPREGHSMVGVGTYTDARVGWTKLAKEYASISNMRKKDDSFEEGKSESHGLIIEGEPQLFQRLGATLIGIEYIGEENPRYWIESGGAMARFFFL